VAEAAVELEAEVVEVVGEEAVEEEAAAAVEVEAEVEVAGAEEEAAVAEVAR
jgi:hypothetical protein